MKKILLAGCVAVFALSAAQAQTQTRSHHSRNTTVTPATGSATTTDQQSTDGAATTGTRKNSRPHRVSNPGAGAGSEMRNGTESVGPLGNGAGGSTIGSTRTDAGSTGNGTNTYSNGTGNTVQPAAGTTPAPATGR